MERSNKDNHDLRNALKAVQLAGELFANGTDLSEDEVREIGRRLIEAHKVLANQIVV